MPQLIDLLGTTQIKYILILIVVDVVLGIIAALAKKDFRLGKLANFMVKPVLGYVLGFAVLKSVASVLPSLAMVAKMAYVLILLALVGSILNNLGKIGLKLPAFLLKD